MTAAADTYSNTLTRAIGSILEANIPSCSPCPLNTNADYVYSLEDATKPVKFPTVFIDENSDELTMMTCRGLKADGTLQPGVTGSRFSFTVFVYCKGRTPSKVEAEIKRWLDCAWAVLENNPTLGLLGCEIVPRSREPLRGYNEGDLTVRMGGLQTECLAFWQQGSTALLGSEN